LQNDLILHLQYQEIELITVSSHWTPAVTFLSTSFTTHQITKNLESNSTDILPSQMIMTSTYVACEYDDHW
jgi:hypothetical protein